MNCFNNSQEPPFSVALLRSDGTLLERDDILSNAIKKLAMKGPGADILNEAILYRVLMREIMGELLRDKEGRDHIMFFLNAGLTSSSDVKLTDDEKYLFKVLQGKAPASDAGAPKEKRYKFCFDIDVYRYTNKVPFYEYSDDLKAYIKEMRTWLGVPAESDMSVRNYVAEGSEPPSLTR